MINTQTMTIALPQQKIHLIQKEARHLLSLDAVQMRTLAHFIGTLVATRPAVPMGALHYRALQDLKIRTLHQSSSYQMMGQITKDVQVDQQWWATQLPTCCSSPIVKQEAKIVIESDASNSGWGAVCQGVRTEGRWMPQEAQQHINYLELKAVFLALQSFLKTKNGINVLIRSDNRTAIAYINKMGAPTMTQLCSLALQIWQWCLAQQITPHAEYLAGKENIIADWESRHHDSSDWQLLPSIFDGINDLLGPFNLDLFANRTNAQLPDYYSWKPDPYAKTVDAFTVSWSQDQPYLFPPFNLIGRALTKIQTDAVKYACLIAPAWPAQVLVPASTSDVGQMPSSPTNGTRPAAEPRPEASSSSVRGTDVSSRMAHLRQTYAMQGFSERVTELLLQSWRANTHSACNSAWSKWCGWCNQRQIHPFSASLEEIMEFLADQFDSGLQYRSLNILRSAISTSHSKVDSHNVGSHPLVSRLLKGMFNVRPPAP